MKKNLLALGVMLAATFTLTNCTKEIQDPDAGKTPYTIYANASETKTANDGLSTVWVKGDALNVFHAAAGSTEYSANTQFTLTDAATGQFDTEALAGDLSATNDWYALYPYNKYVTTPASTNSGYINVGAVTIKQNGYDNMDHLSGSNCPLYGVAKGVSAQTLPGLAMHHLTSVVKVEVTNNAGKAVTISNVALTAEEDIVGTYYVNFAGEEVEYTGSGESYVSSTATLAVSGPSELPAGKTATFYIPVKPFVAPAGTELVLAVNGEDKSLEMSKNVSFDAGSIKTLKYSVDEVVEQEVLTISEVIASDNGAQVLTEGLVVGTYARGVLIQDNTGYILVYDGSSAPAKVGDMIEVSGSRGSFGGLAQIGSPVVTVKSSGNTVTRPAATVLDGAAMDEQLTATEVSYVEYTGTLAVSGSYYNVTVEGASTAVGSLSYPDASLGLTDFNGKTIKVTGYFVGVSSSKYVNTMVVAVEEVTTGEEPEPEPEPGDGTATFDFNANEWGLPVSATGTESDGNIVAPVTSGDVTMTVYNGTASTAARLWKGSSKVDLRAYKNSSLAFSVPKGYVITKMTFSGSKVGDALFAPVNGTYSSNVWEGKSNPVIFNIGGTINVDKIVVEYEAGTGESPELPEDSGDSGDQEDPATPPTSSGTKTVAEFINAADTQNYYELTGTVSNFNANYCSFDLTDESGTIYVYSVLAASKTEWSSKISNGGTVTLLGKYLYYEKGSKHEVVDAHIVSFTEGAVEPEQPGTGGDTEGTTVTFDWTTLATTTDTEYTGQTVDGVTLQGYRIATNKAGQLRVYKPDDGDNAYFTLSADKLITKVEITFTGEANDGPLSADGYADGIWTGSANSVTFTNTSAEQARITKIVVTLGD